MAEMFDLVIRGGLVASAEGCFQGDVGITGGRVEALGLELGTGTDEIYATGRIITPGGVDPHAHIEQLSGMGIWSADDFESATQSAAMGGTTSVISFAAQHKGQRLQAVMEDYAARAARGAMIDHAFHLIVSDTDVPDFDSDLRALIGQGHRSIKLFTTYGIKVDDTQILDVMTVAKEAGALVCVHAENDGLIGWAKARLLASGRTRPEHHALSHPRAAEVEAVQRLCHFAEFLNQPVMLFHISTAEGVAAVRAARARGAPVWAETCPHYLMMTDEVLTRDGVEGAKWMCSPPQRKSADSAALWRGLALGDLQVVSSDHAPYRFDETGKLAAGMDAPFTKIANGLPGLEVRMPLLFDAMVSGNRQGLAKFVEVTATAPAALYGLATKGRLAPGMDADVVIWDAARETTYGTNDLHDKVDYNPWEGRRVKGWPETVLLRGQTIVSEGQFHATPGQGRWLPRPVPGIQATGDLPP